MPRRSDEELRPPWVPQTLQVFPVRRRVTTARPRGAGADRSAGKERPCWDLRWRVDGRDFSQRFYKAADAAVWAEQLRAGHLRGWVFDAKARRFAAPETAAPERSADTVFSWTGEYWEAKWPTLELRGRPELSRYLNRARRFFVDAEPAAAEADALAAFLGSSSLTVREHELTPEQELGRRWLEQHSTPLADVDRRQLERLLAHFRVNQRDPTRQVAPASERRMVADLRQCWDQAVREERLESNPWDKVDLRARSSAIGGRRQTRSTLAADAELVLAPDQIWQLAHACGELGSWGHVVDCFVLVMGLCGLRPNEAVGLVIGDLELPDAEPGWLTVRRTRRRVADRYLDLQDDPEWGPLKGRELTATRRVPVPAPVAQQLRLHLDTYRAAARRHDLVFERRSHPFDLSSFHDEVWVPGREALFPPIEGIPPASPMQPKLSRLRRHDLRHSACSLWLRSRVDVTVCQRWSGHKQLSVFLDIYQGLIPGGEEEGVRLLAQQIAAELPGRKTAAAPHPPP